MVDGEHRASVANDDSIDIPVTAAMHRVRIAIDWSGSEEIEVGVPSGDVVTMECTARPLSTMPLDLFSRTQWVELRRCL